MARGRERGFTLLEVLVALSILSLSLAVVYQAFGTGLRSDREVGRYREAVALAETRLALIGTELPATVGQWRGETDGLRWVVKVAPAEDEPLLQKPAPLRLLDVAVGVSWSERGRERSVTLGTFRLGPQEDRQ